MLRKATGVGLLGALMLAISGCVVYDDRGYYGGRGYYSGHHYGHHGHHGHRRHHWR